jgi:tetratricopeptide (TPR) repeat protein
MAEEIEEYKVIANDLKDQGNQAFQEGNVQEAIRLFTQAIDLDPDNHVYYSNRAAAYMKADSKSKALHDAEKCVELAPSWSKGYSRLGAAQQSLRRFEQAIDSFKKGIELDPNNKTLWAAIKCCQDAFDVDKKHRFEGAKLEREAEEKRIQLRDKVKREMEEEKKKRMEDERNDSLMSDFLSNMATDSSTVGNDANEKKGETIQEEEGGDENALADFFLAVSSTETKKPAPKEKQTDESSGTGEGDAAAAAGKDETSLTEKYLNQDLGDGRKQCERLLAPHYEWRNLNPYAVLQLGADATEEDIKLRYKKLSLKVHPDRLRDMENARTAFEQVWLRYPCPVSIHFIYTVLIDEFSTLYVAYHLLQIVPNLTLKFFLRCRSKRRTPSYVTKS